jgi:phage terminase small subunit
MKLVDKPLTAKQKMFAELYVQLFGKKSATECAIDAGYAKESAYQRAHELLNPKICPHVVKYIDEIKSHIEEKYKVTFESHVKELWELREKKQKRKIIFKLLYVQKS